MAETLKNVRPVAAIVDSIETLEGGGFLVHRPFPIATLDMIDPFLLLDEMGPTEVAPGEAVGAPDHPHRGFETVTYMLEGEFEHRDSAGPTASSTLATCSG
jgi:redox-sensitive bicupin YhaK (pirin superfamily)